MAKSSDVKRFRGKIDIWWYGVLAAVAAVTVWQLILVFRTPGFLFTFSALLLGLACLYALSVTLRNELLLENDCLVICFGPETRRIAYAQIVEVRRVRNAWSASSLSLDRYRIRTADRQLFFVSAADMDAFGRELMERRTLALNAERAARP